MMQDAELDLSIETLTKACKGNVALLPSFMVHNNAVWPTGRVALDTKNRIHMRRASFLRNVAAKLPVKEGIWHRIDVQEFHLDLQPHHLQGSQDMAPAEGHKHSRDIVLLDKWGRPQWDRDYGITPARNNRAADIAADVRNAKAAGTSRSVRANIFDGMGGE